jgi:hypothetical protein
MTPEQEQDLVNTLKRSEDRDASLKLAAEAIFDQVVPGLCSYEKGKAAFVQTILDSPAKLATVVKTTIDALATVPPTGKAVDAGLFSGTSKSASDIRNSHAYRTVSPMSSITF